MRKIETTLGDLVNAEPALHRIVALTLDAKTRYHAKHFQEERHVALRRR